MKEAEFQQRVVVPLFRAMKFRDVTPFDGRSLEKGKDVVMWKEGHLGERINYGVLVKSVKVTGKATGKNSASDILNQANQMLTAEFNDPVTARKQEIQRCYVISSKTISKEAIHSIESQLSRFNLDKVISFIHPDSNLFDLIEKYLPEQNIFEKLSSSQKELDELMKDVPYRLVANTRNEISIEGKVPNAHEQHPFTVNGKLRFPKTPEGIKAKKAFEKHIKTGAPVEVKGTFIESFSLPEFLPSWMKPTSTEDSVLILKQVRTGRKFPIRAEIKSEDGSECVLEYIDLEVIQHGTEEVTLRNDKQNVPWEVTLILNFQSRRVNINFNLKPEGVNVVQELQRQRFFHAFTYKNGQIIIRQLETGIIVLKSALKAKEADENLESFIRLLKELSFIQEKTSNILTILQEEISPEDAKHIFTTSQILRTGKAVFNLQVFESLVDVDEANEILELFADKLPREVFINIEEQKTEILGTEINLGQTFVRAVAYITDEDLLRIKEEIKKSKSKDRIIFRYTPITEVDVTALYVKWLPEDEANQISNTFLRPITD